MTAYRIEYTTLGCDCWGRTEWDFWRTYDDKVYSTEAKAQEAIQKINDTCSDRKYRVSEVEFVTD